MFGNIGSKIKSLAKIVCWIGIVVFTILGLVSIGDTPVLGLLIVILGSLCSWIGSFFVYGFGELIEKTTEIAENTRSGNTKNKNTSNNYNEIKSNNNHQTKKVSYPDVHIKNDDGENFDYETSMPKTTCPSCGTQHDFDYPKCPNCGYKYEE